MASQGNIDRDEDDEDAISITSTVPSEPQEEYIIAGVLAERTTDNGVTEYLVSWENYPIHRSSWEPADHFGDPETTLREWNEKKEAIQKGTALGFDVLAFEKLLVEIETAKLRRARKRRLKRMRLGLAYGSEPEDTDSGKDKETDDSSSDNSSSDESTTRRTPPASRKGRGKLLPKKNLATTGKSSESAVDSSDAGNGRTFKSALRDASHPPKQLQIPPSSISKSKPTAPPSIRSSEKPNPKLPIRKPSVKPSVNVTAPGGGDRTVQPPTAGHPISMSSRKPVSTFAPPTARRGGSMAAATGGRQLPKPPNIGLFRTLSTQRKHHKMSRADRAPDISQLDLRPPSEWLTAAGRSTLTELPTCRKRPRLSSMSPPIDTLFVAQDGNNGSLSNPSPPVPPAPPRDPGNNTSAPAPLVQGKVTLPETPTSQIPQPLPESATAQKKKPLQKATTPASTLGPEIQREPVRDDPGQLLAFRKARGGDYWAPRLSTEDTRREGKHNQGHPPPHGSDNNPGSRVNRKPSNMKNWRSWNKGDVMVRLVFSALGKEIGDIRISGLPPPVKNWLLSLKKGARVVIDLQKVCSPEEYHKLKINKTDHGNVVPYDDTMNEINYLAEHLLNSRSAATWSPSTKSNRLIIIYPSQAQEWKFLHTKKPLHPSPRLLLVVADLLNVAEPRKVSPPRLMPISPLQTQLSERPAKATGERVLTQESKEIAARITTDTSNLAPIQEPPPPKIPPPPPNELAASPVQQSSRETIAKPLPERTRDLDVATYFKNHYRITLEYLAHPKHRKAAQPVFYLLFPSTESEEHELVQQLLVFHRIAPYSHQNQGDWEKFINDVAESKVETQGVILCHQKFNAYNCMPRLYKLLHCQTNVFSLSLARPIKWASNNRHIIRLFPTGCVILITEDFILHDPKGALRVIEWVSTIFWDYNVNVWLQQMWPTWPDETLYHIFCLLNALMPENPSVREGSPGSLDRETGDEGQPSVIMSTRHIPDYGVRSEDEHPDIPKDLTQEQRNTDHLIEYFAGWAITNVENFRYFPVLVYSMPQPRWEKWSHIEILNYSAFNKRYMKADVAVAGKSMENQMDQRQLSLPTTVGS
ncbi:hypothetical protein MGYG_03804 [Nannizzia gypsea CBS 118893]|uniref:Chromo domain-containing protein n=1 Tax=Arthroderma gypseum (strain ATCC MYA-4604 / CBS 118893) TaxID=535722 RepID=E4UTZ3_ARTGP|nr:hypothetical protein MGYG_03804 [Nannizzia gypsea CBS 118893]EFR00799.1 hypothetical protein MGYG_03804 [Nannizzia gypsea CBS 118893]